MVAWLQKNKLLVLSVVIALFIVGVRGSHRGFAPMYSKDVSGVAPMMTGGFGEAVGVDSGTVSVQSSKTMMPPYPGAYGESVTLDVDKRLVVTESSFSLLVKDVRDSITQIKNKVGSLGGFMVSSYVNDPGESSQGSITVRVPSNQVDALVEFMRGSAVRVVSENVNGTDVTDQYTDYQARLDTLEATKLKFEDILEGASQVADILQVQQSIINLQDQIDSITGQIKQLEQTSSTSRVMIYLSTDELALPYAPSEPWRPDVVAKQAIRSLIGNIRSVGTLAIWLLVYSIFWLPAVIVVASVFVARKLWRKK